ncbi:MULTISPECIES: PQQ-dependent sugar dehydrogenase [unclassified Variovorax]|uniref:PQQ-dependent sugar dehydrogenase n=1 Tax=unclassified Variovorax TaxID=663243 RepID=UPI003ECF365B
MKTDFLLGLRNLTALLLALPGLPCTAAGTGTWVQRVIASDLVYPWSIVRSGDALLITEVAGSVVTVRDGKSTRRTVQTSSPIVHEGGSGLLGMALAPDFERSGTAYLYHSYRSGTGLANKLVQVQRENDTFRETRVLLQGIPGHTLYNGGRIAIGPDGHLYVATGWAHEEAYAQDLRSLGGKILRLRLDGGVPADNPFAGSYVWSYGHRNPQGLAWSADGRLFVAEHGPSGHDEINVIVPGGNYGWPRALGDQRSSGVTPPLVHSGTQTWAPAGIAFFKGQLMVAALQSRGMHQLVVADKTMPLVFSSNDRLRDLLPVGDALYAITTNTSPRASRSAGPDRLLLLTPAP